MQTALRKTRRARLRPPRIRRNGQAAGRQLPAACDSRAVHHAGRHRGRTEADFAVPPSLDQPKVVFLNCHYCGYSPQAIPENETCPKCGGHSWERFALSAKLVQRMQG